MFDAGVGFGFAGQILQLFKTFASASEVSRGCGEVEHQAVEQQVAPLGIDFRFSSFQCQEERRGTFSVLQQLQLHDVSVNA
ncbi:hypothetical protein D3C76_1515350 [compost metagenome]